MAGLSEAAASESYASSPQSALGYMYRSLAHRAMQWHAQLHVNTVLSPPKFNAATTASPGSNGTRGSSIGT